MRKILIIILDIALIALVGYIAIEGISIGNQEVFGFEQLKQESESLDNSLEEVSQLINRDYPKAINDLETAEKNLQTQKESYNDLVVISTDNITTSSQYGNYELEYLWTIIGRHATSEGVELKMEIVNNTTSVSSQMYDLKFTVTGDYVSITNFIELIENDTALGFKIEEFKLLPSGDNLIATFTCKEISIKIDSQLLTQSTDNVINSNGTTQDTTNNSVSSNSTNSSSSSNSSNTTNATNTTNTTDTTNTSTSTNNT